MAGNRIGVCDLTGADPIELRFKHEAVIALGFRTGNLQEILAAKKSARQAVDDHFFHDRPNPAGDGYGSKAANQRLLDQWETAKELCLEHDSVESLKHIKVSDHNSEFRQALEIAIHEFTGSGVIKLKILTRAIDAEMIAEDEEKMLKIAGVKYNDGLIKEAKEGNLAKVGPKLMRVIERRQDMLVALLEKDGI